MDLSEDEKRMVYQIEGTDQNTALNEVYMTWRYADSQAVKDTAEGVLRKLRPLSDRECMDVIREVQRTYRLPEKPRTIGELLAEARQKSGAQKLAGHDIMALERFDPDTRHMIVFDVLTHDSPVDWKPGGAASEVTGAGKRPGRADRSAASRQIVRERRRPQISKERFFLSRFVKTVRFLLARI